MLLLSLLFGAFLTAPALAQSECPGYTATNIQQTSTGVTADLELAGPACDIYGTDLTELTLTVEYQTGEWTDFRLPSINLTSLYSYTTSCHHSGSEPNRLSSPRECCTSINRIRFSCFVGFSTDLHLHGESIHVRRLSPKWGSTVRHIRLANDI